MAGGVDRFVHKRPDTSAHGNSFDSGRPAPNHTVSKRQRRVQDAYVEVPKTLLGAPPEAHPPSKFDETEYEESTMSSFGGAAGEETYVSSPDDEPFSPSLSRAVHARYHQHQNGREANEYEDHAKLDEEMRQEHYQDNELGKLPLANEIAEARRNSAANIEYFQAHSPSIRKRINPQVHPPRSDSPVPLRESRPPSRPRSSHQAGMPPPANAFTKFPITVAPPNPATTTAMTDFDKTSSYSDSPTDRTPPPLDTTGDTNRARRPHSDDVDYDPPNLKALSFETLDTQPFDLDPRRPPPNSSSSPYSSSSLPPSTKPTDTHTQKLATLRSLSATERSRYFSAQTKDQWEQSATFFGKRLDELFQELREARQKRREVAYGFEREVKRRMDEVAGGGREIERCLDEMRGKARGVLPGRMGTPGLGR